MSSQIERVWEVMREGTPLTVAEIAELTGDAQTSVSARLRDLRKERFGGHTIERRRQSDGFYCYTLIASGANMEIIFAALHGEQK